jgi:hypothetical protein
MSKHAASCKLCNEVRPLCRSHIVPELAYAPIKNEKDQIYAVGKKVRKVQTGYFERLLCAECESLLSDYETTFKRIWMDTIPPVLPNVQPGRRDMHIDVRVDDYDSFKLFHLSVLWRAAASTGFKAESMSLGPYADQLAAMLRNKDAGEIGAHPFFGVLNIDEYNRPVPIVSPLAKGHGRFEGHHYYMMSYAYCDWTFIVGNPGPYWLVELEAQCREEKYVPLLTARHRESKSLKLWAEFIHHMRR